MMRICTYIIFLIFLIAPNFATADITVLWQASNASCGTPTVYLFNMDGSGGEVSPWPGEAMIDTDGDGWYEYTLIGFINTELVFSCSGANQTADLYVEGTACYDNGWVACPGGGSGNLDVSWIPQGSCGTPYLYVWDMDGVADTEVAPWPGIAMTDNDGDGIFDLSFPYDCANIIFNCAGSSQSADILNICTEYCYEGSADGGMSVSCEPMAPDVIIAPVGGTYPDDPLSISLSLSDNTACPIYYTTDGSTPDMNSAIYTAGSLILPGTAGTGQTVKAITFCNNMYSSVATETYIFENTPTTVVVNPAGGTKPAGMLNVSLGLNDNSACDIYYTLDGTNPTQSSIPYTGSFVINGSANTSTTVKAIAYCNSIATPIETETYTFVDAPPVDECFLWDNATIYFVLTDRFNNANTSNDLSYGRQYDPIGGFLGGDLQGLTAKINEGYFDDLGVNAIWITPPYEQIHGAVPGYWGPNGFPGESHYAYHGYYALDFTEVDNNYGTAADMEAFVDAAHAHGIRIIMDIVVNHVGYETTADVAEFGLGDFGDPWVPDNPTLNADDPAWCNWWTDNNGNPWIRKGDTATDFCALACGGSDKELCLAGLPDVLTELATPVGLPKILETKWGGAGSSKYTTEAAELNTFFTNQNLTATPANHIIKWLTDWVRDYGIDGFRIDTYKHVETPIWGTLKEQAQIALDEWRVNNPTKPLAGQVTPFWMVGELYGHGPNKNVDAVVNGKTDALINFNFQGQDGEPTALDGTYAGYAGLVADPEWNIVSYISSHDTELSNRADLVDGGTSLLLAPGAVQIFYGDETGRQPSSSGSDQDTRSFMNWGSVDNTVLSHWQKIGQFRRCHPAVGAGTHTKLGDAPYTFLREYINADAGICDKVIVAVGASSGTPISVGGAIADGTVLRDAYTGEVSTVSGGMVVYNNVGTAGVVLMEPTSPLPCIALTISPELCYSDAPVMVAIDATDGNSTATPTIYYSFNANADPNNLNDWTLYTGPFSMTQTGTVYAFGMNAAGEQSVVISQEYNIGTAPSMHIRWHVDDIGCTPRYVYIWEMDGVADAEVAPWPGVMMTNTDVDEWFEYTLDSACYANVIFNCGFGGFQTGDLFLSGDGCYNGGWVTCPLDPVDPGDCPVTMIINDDGISSNIYSVEQTIESAGRVLAGDNVNFEAGTSILLNAGFEVVLGAEFLAEIKACSAAREGEVLLKKK